MRHIKLFSLTFMVVALASACGGRPMGTGGGGGGASAGGGTGTGGSGGSGGNGGGTGTGGSGGGTATGGGTGGSGGSGGGSGGGSAGCPVITVNDAVNDLIMYDQGCVEIDNAVVVGASTAFASTSATCVGNKMVETFVIQDNNAAAGSPGVTVYKACKDNTMALPNVGDLVTVSGRLAKFDASLQISTYKMTILEQLSVTGSGGMSSSGAYPPAGMPVEIAGTDMSYAHDSAGGDPHSDQLGQALHFSNVTVVNRYPVGFYSTNSDGGHSTAGFELSNGVWVNDSIIYFDCIKPLGSDAGIPLPNGIKGFWDRYQDFYGVVYFPDGGFNMYSPTVPVLTPLTCADLQ